MIIIYEIGDRVELDDDYRVPGGLANHLVQLKRKSKTSEDVWLVESEDNGETAFINKKWFLRGWG